jgi:hypothetical protein
MPDVSTTLRAPNYASAPSSPTKGQVYFDTTTNSFFYYNGTAWIPVNVGNSGTPTAGQWAQWVTANTIKGLTFASFQSSATVSPTKFTSAGGAMVGLGSAAWGSASITPTATGKVLITIQGGVFNDVATGQAAVGIRYGTGTAPLNAGALAGTQTIPFVIRGGVGANLSTPFSVSTIVTGLTVGTPYWIDLNALNNNTSGAVGLQIASVVAIELP